MLADLLTRALTITWFVVVMMVLVEYVNVLSTGRLRAALGGSRWLQYLAAAGLGAVPGCLGAFVVVTLYVHRSVGLGALVACMIATSGDEAFVMLATFPATAVAMTGGLLAVGLLAGALTDLVAGSRGTAAGCDEMLTHDVEVSCRCFDPATLPGQLRRPRLPRAVLVIGVGLFAAAVGTGLAGPPSWGWVRVTLLVVAGVALFVVSTVPDHFIEEHLWRHVALRHGPRVFLWTFGAMAVIASVDTLLPGVDPVRDNPAAALAVAALLGLVPESGPHLLVVMLFADGQLPLSVLVASSIVQDGHGMLPLLAHSRRAFVVVKAINLAVGLLVGGAMMAAGR